MASNFPTSLDNFTNPSSGNTLDSPSHSLQHSDINDAVEALEAKLGIGASPAGSATSGQVLTAGTAGITTWSTPTIDGLVAVVPSSISVGSGSASASAVGAISITSASSVSINGVFSSSYDNYKIVFSNMTGSGASQNIRFRLRKSGTDNSSNIYYIQYISANNTSIGGARVTQTQWVVGDVRDQGPMALTLDLFNPNNASVKTNCLTFDMQNSTTEPILYFAALTHDLASSADFDGFTIFPASGTMSGQVSVYGYRK